MRPYAFLAAAALMSAAAPERARADGFHLRDDPRFSAGAHAGIFHLGDSRFDVTWYQLLILDAAWSPYVRDRSWFPRLELHGSLMIDRADLAYREEPASVSDGNLAGIHRAVVSSPISLSYSAGGRLTLFENRRFHLDLYAEAMRMVRPAEVEPDELAVEVNGLQIDVARAVREYATLTFDWRTARAGLAAGAIVYPWGYRTVPYLTLGLFHYEATFSFEDLDPRLESALVGFGVDPEVVHERGVSKTKFFGTTGVRVDLSRRWSLDVATLVGRVDDAWLYSFQAGGTIRW